MRHVLGQRFFASPSHGGDSMADQLTQRITQKSGRRHHKRATRFFVVFVQFFRPSICSSLSLALCSAKVQVSALKACSALLAYLSMDDDGLKFRSLVQPCLQVRVFCMMRSTLRKPGCLALALLCDGTTLVLIVLRGWFSQRTGCVL